MTGVRVSDIDTLARQVAEQAADPVLGWQWHRGSGARRGASLIGVPPEVLEALADLVESESEEGMEARNLVASLLVYLVVEDRLLNPKSGILKDFKDTLDETVYLVEKYAR